VDQFRQTAGAGSLEIKQIFGDDKQVCVVCTVTAVRLVGSGAADDDLPQRSRTCSCRGGGGDMRRRSALPDRLTTSLIRATSVANAVGFRGFVRCAGTVADLCRLGNLDRLLGPNSVSPRFTNWVGP
jgi:hypothetical protein